VTSPASYASGSLLSRRAHPADDVPLMANGRVIDWWRVWAVVLLIPFGLKKKLLMRRNGMIKSDVCGIEDYRLYFQTKLLNILRDFLDD
jgi:hypothetical protein